MEDTAVPCSGRQHVPHAMAEARYQPMCGCLWTANGDSPAKRSIVESGTLNIAVRLKDQDRFLTLVATDGGNGFDWDFVMFGDPRLELKFTAPQ